MSEQKKANALINQTSPYLIQHAYNPVAWYPWSEEALHRARQENKPILLSIGYSACHWCHVMAHESFEDLETAGLMNEYFINIKIDREERPDIDKIYQTAQYILTQRSGGWPLTMFLSADNHIPFFGGTYFPPTARHGLPGFKDLLLRVAKYYQQEQQTIRQQNNSVMQALQNPQLLESGDESVTVDKTPLQGSITELTGSFDQHYGGFGGAPKFPTPTNIVRLLHHHELDPENQQTLNMALHTLRQMAGGGIYDQIGGGFCRYSVDHKWLIPHFEKMLYDNGQLLDLYTDAWHISREDLFKKVVLETAEWLIREMQSPEGGFYSSLDADSEGVEGKFYVWTPDEARVVLNTSEYDLAAMHFGLDQPANFEGLWHLFISQSLDKVATNYNLNIETTIKTIDTARKKLYAARKARIWPGYDEKILTSWNALTIKGLANSAILFERDDFRQCAEAALDFIHDKLWQQDRLLVTYKDGKAHLNAYLDDYAYLVDAILVLLQARWSGKWLEFAIQLADGILEYFYDDEKYGFFFTSHDHEDLIQRRKDFMDDAIPSGNGIAARALARLGHLINEHRYTDAAYNTIKAAWHAVERAPSTHNSMLFALQDYLYPPMQIILRGKPVVIDCWKRHCLELAGIRSQIYTIPDNTTDLPEILDHKAAHGDATAYICEGFKCLEPLSNLDELTDHLKSLT